MNNRGQIQAVAFFAVTLLAIIIIAPIMLKVGVTTLSQTATQLSIIQPNNVSANATMAVQGKLTGSLDWIIMLLVFIDILVMMFTAFLIDIHPAFVVIYIIGALALVLTVPLTVMAAEKVYQSGDLSSFVTYIPMTEFFMNNFAVVIVGVLVLTGIIMFAKVRAKKSAVGGGGIY